MDLMEYKAKQGQEWLQILNLEKLAEQQYHQLRWERMEQVLVEKKFRL